MVEDWFKKKEDNLGLIYEQKAVPDHSYFVYVKTKNFIDFAKQYFGNLKDKNCLDIGCGSGETTSYLENEFKCVVGLDYSLGMILEGKNKLLKPTTSLIAGDASSIPITNNSFDVVVFFNIFHHVESKESLIKMMSNSKNIIKKNGLIAIIEINPYNPVSRNVIKTCEIDEGVSLDGFKKNLFPTTLFPYETENLLRSANIQLLNTTYFIFFPKILKALLFVERIFKKIPLGGLYMVVGNKSK